MVAIMKTTDDWRYNLPIFRRSHRAESPDGKMVAEISVAQEVGMSNPTSGLLELSSGMSIPNCNPSFVWSDNSRYLAVPEWANAWGLFQGMQLLIVEPNSREVHIACWAWGFIQPESFCNGELVAILNPARRRPKRQSWRIPDELPRLRHRHVTA